MTRNDKDALTQCMEVARRNPRRAEHLQAKLDSGEWLNWSQSLPRLVCRSMHGICCRGSYRLAMPMKITMTQRNPMP